MWLFTLSAAPTLRSASISRIHLSLSYNNVHFQIKNTTRILRLPSANFCKSTFSQDTFKCWHLRHTSVLLIAHSPAWPHSSNSDLNWTHPVVLWLHTHASNPPPSQYIAVCVALWEYSSHLISVLATLQWASFLNLTILSPLNTRIEAFHAAGRLRPCLC